MAIDEEFYKNLKPVEKHHDHYVWGPGKIGAAAEDPNVKAAYEKAGKKIEPLGVHGTYVAVDWDDCEGEGSCLSVCPTTVFEWAKNPGNSGQDDRLDYTDKSDPIREADCIWCMACVTACPTQAIKVDEALVEVHNNIKL
ncbi:MAG: ferredoxin family protein [Nitrososphaerales archaeon]